MCGRRRRGAQDRGVGDGVDAVAAADRDGSELGDRAPAEQRGDVVEVRAMRAADGVRQANRGRELPRKRARERVVVTQRRAGAVDERVVRVGDRRRGERQRGTSADEHLVDDLAGHHLRLRCACSEGEVADERRGAQGGIHAGADVGDP